MDEAARRARRRQRWLARAEEAGDAFGLLLLLVLATYVLTSLLSDRGWDAVILCLSTSATSIVSLTSARAGGRSVRLAIGVSALSVVLAAIAAASDARAWLNVATALQVILLAVATGAVLRRVVANAGADSRTILGAIGVYAVFGLLFTFLYSFVSHVQNGDFFEGHPETTGSDFVFFSYTTLTTTGFGDLVPAGQPGRMLAGLEMMVGQIFLVTLVAGLVALWRPGERLRRRRGDGAKVPHAGE